MRSLLTLLVVAAGFVGLLIACIGSDKDGRYFALATASQTARAALIDASDLPGDGWELTVREGKNASEELTQSDIVAANEPSCAEMQDLRAGGYDVFGASDDDIVSRAEVNFTSSKHVGWLPTLDTVEIEIVADVSKIEDDWSVLEPWFKSGKGSRCFNRLLEAIFSPDEPDAATSIKVEPRDVLAGTPQEGAAVVYLITFSSPSAISRVMVMEIHFWTYANARISIILSGSAQDLNREFVSQLVSAIDAKVVAAEAAQ